MHVPLVPCSTFGSKVLTVLRKLIPSPDLFMELYMHLITYFFRLPNPYFFRLPNPYFFRLPNPNFFRLPNPNPKTGDDAITWKLSFSRAFS